MQPIILFSTYVTLRFTVGTIGGQHTAAVFDLLWQWSLAHDPIFRFQISHDPSNSTAVSIFVA